MPRPASAIAASAAAKFHECDVEWVSMKSITDSGSWTRTSTSDSGPIGPRTSAMCVASVSFSR